MLADIITKIAFGEQESDHGFYPRPSIAGPERCLRSMVYWAMGTPPQPFPGRTMLVFSDGNWHAELTKDLLRRTAFQVHSEEMEVETPCGKGHIDGIVTDLLGIDRLLEIKSANHFSFERMWSGQMPADYLTQCALYMNGLQRMQPDLREGLLLIKSKNTSAFVEIRFSYSSDSDELALLEMVRSDGQVRPAAGVYPGITRKAWDRFGIVAEYAKRGELPMRPFEYGCDWPCGYCRWARSCWDGYEQEFADRGEAPVDDPAVRDMAVEYVSNARATKILEDRQEMLKGSIKGRLTELKAKAALYPEVRVLLDLRKRSSVDQTKIPASVLEAAKRITFSEVLTVREAKREQP